MTSLAFILILLSSTLHATWNLLTKRAHGGVVFTWLFGALAMIVYAPIVGAVYWLQQPEMTITSWLFVGGSALLHTVYLLTLQYAYRLGDMSLVYPLARGSGPALTLIVAILFFKETVSSWAFVGIGLIIVGTFVFSRSNVATQNVPNRAAVLYGLLTGVFIAAYTLWDKYAVSQLLIPPIIYDWGANVVRTVLLSFMFFNKNVRQTLRITYRTVGKEAWGIAILSPLAYILVLTAMTFTQVSYVAPAREISILIGTVMGTRFFNEGQSKRRYTAAGMMVIGVVLLALN